VLRGLTDKPVNHDTISNNTINRYGHAIPILSAIPVYPYLDRNREATDL
jgi:hypothetical protein